ncbi:MAG: aminotransferase class III-fold pyridoxal phosphate-dependent enzyme [Arenicellales bacterium]
MSNTQAPQLPGAAPSVGGAQDVFYADSNIVPLPMITRAKGIYMWDEDGNEYIDASSGPVISNIGHGNVHVADAMAEQAKQMDFAYSRLARHGPNVALTDRIARLAGPGFERVALSSGGSEAMEIAIKFVRQYTVATGAPKRRHLITCLPSYHGGTIATLGMSGDDALGTFFDGFGMTSHKVPAPLTYRLPESHTLQSYTQFTLEALEEKIRELGPDTVLAFAVEPVGGLATGCVVPPATYFKGIRDICSDHGIFLIFDEILCGTGRGGKFLSAHHYPDALPDIVVMAKGLGSGYAPLGATLFPANLVERLSTLTGFNFSHTYNANPITCATGLAVLDEYERLNLIDNAATMGRYLKERVRALADEFPVIGDVRGQGLLLGIELVADPVRKQSMSPAFLPTEKIRIHGLNNGLMIYSRRTAGGKYGDWFLLSPPLTITQEECDELLRRLQATLRDFVKDWDNSK